MSKRTFKVWCPDDGETADQFSRNVEAHDAQDAAAEWAQQDDAYGDYTIIKGGDKVVMVACPDHPPRRFVVSGESVARYYAIETPAALNQAKEQTK